MTAKLSEKMNLRLSYELRRQIDTEAARLGIKSTTLMRILLRRGVEQTRAAASVR